MNTYPQSSFSKKRLFMVAALIMGASASASAGDVNVSGRVQMHDVWFSGSGRTSGGTNSFPSGANLRRADLNVDGGLGRDDLSYYVSYRFNTTEKNSNNHIMKAFVKWTNDNFFVKVGQVYAPFGMEHMTSSSNLMFLERSNLENNKNGDDNMDDGVFFSRTWFGVNAGMYTDMFTANLSVVGNALGSHDSTSNNDKYAVLFRGTVAPMQGDDGTIHVGVNAKQKRFNTTNNDGTAAAVTVYDVYPELRSRRNQSIDGLFRWGDSGILDKANYYGFELAGAYDSLNVQGEYMKRKNKYINGVADETAKGWYAQAGYVLTGESRSYDSMNGVFKDPVPAGDCGAWEVALRYSTLNVEETTAAADTGKLNAWTVGVNWFVTSQLKVQANYVASKYKFQVAGTADRKVNGFGLGVQFKF